MKKDILIKKVDVKTMEKFRTYCRKIKMSDPKFKQADMFDLMVAKYSK